MEMYKKIDTALEKLSKRVGNLRYRDLCNKSELGRLANDISLAAVFIGAGEIDDGCKMLSGMGIKK